MKIWADLKARFPLDAIEEHAWIFESEYYKSLPGTAKLTKPTELVSTGESIKLQHACINRTLLWCKLIEAYLIPNLTERTNGQVEFSVSSSRGWGWEALTQCRWYGTELLEP
ncbi:MAG: hypothetical protein Ct9H300mP11_21670 [Chloroflexota bacterium]|nr:MAG: hypothetical protein Ct9H300mP11_21670 [Chloroflexota bacterium]